MDLAAVYSRIVDGKEVTLAPSGWTYNYTFVLYDKETESMWYPVDNGLLSISGHHYKQFLPMLDSEDTVWQKWVKKYPDSMYME